MTFFKRALKYLLILLVIISLILIYPIRRIAQNDAGICIKEGRVLTEAEHRQAFLRSQFQHYINGIDDSKRRGVGSTSKAGIIKNTESLDFLKLLSEFFNNGKSFVENFNIEQFYPRGRINPNQLQEPFIFVSYANVRNDTASFLASKDVVQVDEQESKEIRRKYPPNLYERYHGLGNYYYKIKRILIDIECCNNYNYFYTQEDYLKAKTAAYVKSIYRKDKIGPMTENAIIIASNCGDKFSPYFNRNNKYYQDYSELYKQYRKDDY